MLGISLWSFFRRSCQKLEKPGRFLGYLAYSVREHNNVVSALHFDAGLLGVNAFHNANRRCGGFYSKNRIIPLNKGWRRPAFYKGCRAVNHIEGENINGCATFAPSAEQSAVKQMYGGFGATDAQCALQEITSEIAGALCFLAATHSIRANGVKAVIGGGKCHGGIAGDLAASRGGCEGKLRVIGFSDAAFQEGAFVLSEKFMSGYRSAAFLLDAFDDFGAGYILAVLVLHCYDEPLFSFAEGPGNGGGEAHIVEVLRYSLRQGRVLRPFSAIRESRLGNKLTDQIVLIGAHG